MFITKKSVSRRAVLRGVGATVALPFLDAMVPALTAQARTAANPVRRFGTVFVGLGERPSAWRPATDGVGFEMSPILKPLEGFRDHVTVVSELCTPINGHAPTAAAWSTGVLAKATIAEDVLLGPSIDQIVARAIGGDTVFPSIEVCTEDVTGYLGGCDPAYACAYINTTSWANATTPLPMEINPRTMFERLFGRAGTAAQRLAAQQTDRSILDSVRDDVRELQTGLGRRDQGRLDRVPRQRARDRAAHPARREAERDVGDGARRAGRHPGDLLRAHDADVRPAGGGLAGRHDARLQLHAEPRRQPARVPGDQRQRAAPRDVAPRQGREEARGLSS